MVNVPLKQSGIEWKRTFDTTYPGDRRKSHLQSHMARKSYKTKLWDKNYYNSKYLVINVKYILVFTYAHCLEKIDNNIKVGV